jgi:hypothetical protein
MKHDRHKGFPYPASGIRRNYSPKPRLLRECPVTTRVNLHVGAVRRFTFLGKSYTFFALPRLKDFHQ